MMTSPSDAPMSEPLYTCRMCGVDKPASGFYKHREAKDGIDKGMCRVCRSVKRLSQIQGDFTINDGMRLNHIKRMANNIRTRMNRVHPETRGIFGIYLDEIEREVNAIKRRHSKQEAGVAHE